MMTADNVTVDLRLAQKPDGKLKAFADVVISLEDGEISIFGFSVIGDPCKVVPPARMGNQRWFDVVVISGKLKPLIYTLIAQAYREALAKANEVSA
jgi:hypothetical protein